MLKKMLREARRIGSQPTKSPPPGQHGPLIDTWGKTWEQINAEVVAAVMLSLKGNRRAAAHQLGIAKSTLLKWLEDYGLQDVGRED